jgi:SAM-dependent methyltransferase
MRVSHLESLRPVCPSCKTGSLVLSKTIRGEPADVIEGLIQCDDKACQHEYPIIDGIPILIADLRRVVPEQILGILGRTDLSETTLALLGECSGQGSALDAQRQHISTYAWSHWGDLDPEEPRAGHEHSVVSILDAGLAGLVKGGVVRAGEALPAPIADLGCSVGRTTFHLAARTKGLVLGVDLNFGMLRVARRALMEGTIRYARRRVGLVYDERQFPVALEGKERVDFWCADVMALPFREASFGLASSLNLIDCVSNPLDHLKSIRDIVRPGGGAIVATPFDWSAAATTPGSWLGGHSPRGPARGRSEHVLRSLLGGDHPAAIQGLALVAEEDRLEWPVRLHDRSILRYLVDLIVLSR